MIPKTALVYDHAGLYVTVARALARGFDRVLYFSEWRDAFSTSRGRLIGEGFEDLERVRDFFKALDDADVVVFPDMGRYDLQTYLRAQGMPVWGMGEAEVLEDDKLYFHHWLLTRDLPHADMWSIEGVEALKVFLRDHDEMFLKCNDRGDFETFHHRTWQLSEPWYVDMLNRVGPYQHTMQMLAQAPVEGIEVGYDGYCIDGRYGRMAQLGIECKGTGYVAKLMDFRDLPRPLIQVCEDLAAWTQHEHMTVRGAFSSEVRLADAETGYFIDPTMRFGVPPSACQCAAWTNLAEVVWQGAQGSIIDVVSPKPYLAEVLLESAWPRKHFMAMHWPEEYDGLVSLHRWHRFEGTDYVVPDGHDGGPMAVGAAVGVGNTLKEATEMALEVAESVTAYELDYDSAVFDKLAKTVDEYTALGFDF